MALTRCISDREDTVTVSHGRGATLAVALDDVSVRASPLLHRTLKRQTGMLLALDSTHQDIREFPCYFHELVCTDKSVVVTVRKIK